MMNAQISKVFIIFFLTFCGVYCQQIGKECVIRKNNGRGICTKIYRCNDALQDLRNNVSPTACTYRHFSDVVCCPLQEVAKFTRISEKKCEVYSKLVFTKAPILALIAFAEPEYLENDRCAIKDVPLIVGGEEASEREFPHMALLGFGTPHVEWSCGGTLISERFVITAAHCRKNEPHGEAKYVQVGKIDRNSKRLDHFKVHEFIIYPSYKDNLNYHDIALIKLDRPVVFNEFVRPACLPSYYDEPESKAIAIGFGQTDFAGPSSKSLLKVTLEKFTQKECEASYSPTSELPNGISENTQICAGSRETSKDTCQGDSGGALQIYHHTRYCMYTVIGVTSFGPTCGEIGIPGVYTRVSSYLNWIEGIVWPESL